MAERRLHWPGIIWVVVCFILRNRKAGWFMAIIVLGAFLVTSFYRIVQAYPFAGYSILGWIYTGALVLIAAGFLVYFIKARRRFGIGNKREV